MTFVSKNGKYQYQVQIFDTKKQTWSSGPEFDSRLDWNGDVWHAYTFARPISINDKFYAVTMYNWWEVEDDNIDYYTFKSKKLPPVVFQSRMAKVSVVQSSSLTILAFSIPLKNGTELVK